MMRRRGLLVGLGALLAAPAIIRTPGLLMPVKAVPVDIMDPAEYPTMGDDTEAYAAIIRQYDKLVIRIAMPEWFRLAYA